MNKNTIEFRIILFLSLALGLYLPFLDFSKNEIAIFLIFYLLEIGHIYSSFLKSLNREIIKKSKYIFLVSIITNFLAAIFFPNSFFIFLFYFTLAHYVHKTYKMTSYYGEKNNALAASLLMFIITIILAFHFRDLKFGTDLNYEIRPINIHYYITQDLAVQLYYLLNALGFITLIIGVSYSFKKMKLPSLSIYLFSAINWFIALSLINDIFCAMAILIIPHSLFSFSEIYRSLLKNSEYIKTSKLAIFLIMIVAISASLIELNIEDSSYFFQGYFRILIQAISFFPLTYHYIFEFCESIFEQH
jgi:hypothetical protein